MFKKLVTMGLLSAVGASTAMAVDLDTATDTGVAIAVDSLLTTNKTDGAGANKGTTFYRVVNNANITVTAKAGVGFAVGDQLWVRMDFTNAAFDGAITPAMFVMNASNANDAADSITQGGAAGENSVIFTYTVAGDSLDQGEVFTFTPVNFAVSGTNSVGVTMAVYSTLPDSTNQTNAIVTKSGTMIRPIEGPTTTATAGGETAEVSTNFTAFSTDGKDLNAEIGTINVAVSATSGVKNPASGAGSAVADSVTLGDASSILTLTGDFSFGEWYLDDNANDCASGKAGGTALTIATDKQSATVAAATLTNGADDSVCVSVDGKTAIPQTSAYEYSLKLKTVASAAVPYPTQTGSLGKIAHNGTTVQVPYLTTFEKYNQRLHIVNRGTGDATYSFTFTEEAGTTATAGSMATGTVKGGESLVVKATDIVELSGKTRTAATMTIVAPSANIDVLSNQVNPETGSTDSIKLL